MRINLSKRQQAKLDGLKIRQENKAKKKVIKKSTSTRVAYCNKMRHISKMAAEREAENLRLSYRQPGVQFNVYPCNVCGGYHVGTLKIK